jgi:hypothetical protein
MTLRTLSDICFALGKRPKFMIDSAQQHANEWHTFRPCGAAVEGSRVCYQRTGNVLFLTDQWQKAA